MKIELPEQKTLVHEMTIPIRWGDMDALAHVNNTLYFRYMEIARIEWIAQLGKRLNPSGETFVIGNVFCNFLRQLEYPGDVLIKTYVGSVGRSSIDTYHEMLRTDSGDAVFANGGATLIWVDMTQQKAVLLPEILKQQLPH